MSELREQTTQFIFQQVALRERNSWLGAKISSASTKTNSDVIDQLERWEIPLDERTRQRLQGIQTLPELLECNMLKGVRLDSHKGFWGLLSGKYPLILRTDIPSPGEMLERQCQGQRYVTYLNKPEQLNEPVGRFKNAYEFLMHDLEHAHKFFGDEEMFRGQVNFFNLLKRVLPQVAEWTTDPLFVKDLNYLKSDMNSHPVHLFKYLKAIVLTAELRRGSEDQPHMDRFWNDILEHWNSPVETRRAALRINRPGLETPADQRLVHEFFKSAQAQPQ